jgi:hypothetical protein
MSSHVLRAFSEESGARVTQSFVGALAVNIDGPAALEPAGVAVLAMRHVRDVEAANALGELLVHSGDWKQHLPGSSERRHTSALMVASF